MMDHYFKFCFALQGFSIFDYISKKFLLYFERNDNNFKEFSLFYSTVVIYIILIASMYLFFEHKFDLANMIKDFFIIFILCFAMFILTSIIMWAHTGVFSYFLPRLGDYIIALVCALNSYQFYCFLLTKKYRIGTGTGTTGTNASAYQQIVDS